ncbi:hypothetical protein JYG23_02740 [Sedimentibacter sp. zth1]|uniref:hypothetical protein n=1 Tax=Sedimentibacter sp. zth1 TaxID=2816908 RepID=UPI001A92E52F|nr:hypothetical protein [Sedimentibacter sp. zth1]QSX06396.1 hypothetical protein JYG23_02740 [Sedimentibacter sp. zth1]
MVKNILIVIAILVIALQSVFIFNQFKRIESYEHYVSIGNSIILMDTVEKIISIQNILDEALSNNKIDLKVLDDMLLDYKKIDKDSTIVEFLYKAGNRKKNNTYYEIVDMYNMYEDFILYTKRNIEKNKELKSTKSFNEICRNNKIFIDIMVEMEIVEFRENKYITTNKFVVSELVKDDAYVFNLFYKYLKQLSDEHLEKVRNN